MICSTAFAQSNKWSSLSYSFSKGPVSPEYQYNYTININDNGTGTLIYTKLSASDEYDFKVGKKGMKRLNNALKKSGIFTVSPEEMKSDQNLIGGPSKVLCPASKLISSGITISVVSSFMTLSSSPNILSKS